MPNERRFKIRPAPITITRPLAATRQTLWAAWSDPAHLRRWFAPEGFEITEADVDFRVGGSFSLQVQSPFGQQLTSGGAYTSIISKEEIAFVSRDRKFMSETKVTFADAAEGTVLTIEQTYEVYAPGFLAVAAGAPDGWRTTLDKLETELGRMRELAPAV